MLKQTEFIVSTILYPSCKNREEAFNLFKSEGYILEDKNYIIIFDDGDYVLYEIKNSL